MASTSTSAVAAMTTSFLGLRQSRQSEMGGSQPRCRLGSLPFYMGYFILLEGVYIYKHALIRFVHDSYGEYRSEW